MTTPMTREQTTALLAEIRAQLADPDAVLTWQRRLRLEGVVVGLESVLGDEPAMTDLEEGSR